MHNVKNVQLILKHLFPISKYFLSTEWQHLRLEQHGRKKGKESGSDNQFTTKFLSVLNTLPGCHASRFSYRASPTSIFL